MCLLLLSDINECETQNGGCTHQCINTPGSHYCKCREGTTMNIDNKTCHGKLFLTHLGKSLVFSVGYDDGYEHLRPFNS